MPQEDNLICGFLKLRNGILRGGNLYRVLYNMQQYCDSIYVVDDASYDGTYEYLVTQLPKENIIRVSPEEHDFAKELEWKQKLLHLVHKNGPWKFIMWMDDDEVLDARGTADLRDFCRKVYDKPEIAWKFHYTQFWRNAGWARTDDGFDEGCFIKLWKWTPHLGFKIFGVTHQAQFPDQIMAQMMTNPVCVGNAPYELIHYGNYGVNLRWKCIQYFGGLGGVVRHLKFPQAEYRKVPDNLIPEGITEPDRVIGPEPVTFDDKQVTYIERMENLKELREVFCVIIPTHNRAYTLARALDSLIGQTYDKWICFVLDDGSTDNTERLMYDYQEKDPRIFYARFLERRGGVAMNEIGCRIACETAQWWVRLGSDDWFMSRKLEYDAAALKQHQATYGPFVVSREGKFAEVCQPPIDPNIILEGFLRGGFFASWANIAVRCEVLQLVKEKFGTYCHPDLYNMEDRLMNFRIAKVAKWVWRGVLDNKFVINPDNELCRKAQQKQVEMKADGVWNVNMVGASASGNIYGRDSNVTTRLIEKEKDL